jgi:hypothetical protein
VNDRRDRRVTFFLAAAIVCFALAPLADEFWYVAFFTGVVYVLLALASALDSRSRRRASPREGGRVSP